MTPFALPLAPAAGEALLLGTGILGSGLAAMGIIENKDAISNAVSDFGDLISRGVNNGLRAWSTSMSPNYVGPNIHVDLLTRSPIAVSDATSVVTPMPRIALGLFREVSNPIMLGTPARPIQLEEVVVMGKRKKKKPMGQGSSAPLQPAQPNPEAAPAPDPAPPAPDPAPPAPDPAPATTSTTAAPAPASPSPGGNNNKPSFFRRVKPHLRPFGGYKGGSYMGHAGRVLRDGIYTGFGADVGYNLYETSENPNYKWQWGISRVTTSPVRGLLNLGRQWHNSTPGDSLPQLQDSITTQPAVIPVTPVVFPNDTTQSMRIDPVAPGDTLNIF